ncbi:MAG TPA: FadR/GntR family transcriptional regulator [Bacillota bacterium]|nr:FadR/GntR family transcriptional regulator [Bacillota bacterium]
MMFRPIKRRKRVYENIIDQIKIAIEEGRIKPGDKLPSERQLAEKLNVARTSVKEAITVLESSGVVTVRPGVGMFLNNDSVSVSINKISEIINQRTFEFEKLIEMRQAIEGDAAYYAALRITDEQKKKLTNIYKMLIHSQQQSKEAIEEDYQFHLMIVEAANNSIMLETMHVIAQKIMQGLKESRHTSIQDELLNKAVLEEHRLIYEAIMNNKPEQARDAMWAHHQATKKRYLQTSREKGGVEN